MVVKVGHHQFDQHFVSDHKGVYIQFVAGEFFDTKYIDKFMMLTDDYKWDGVVLKIDILISWAHFMRSTSYWNRHRH